MPSANYSYADKAGAKAAPTGQRAPVGHVSPDHQLRIAVFVSEFPALSETFVMREIVGLIDRGHDVTVFADRRRPEAMTHPDFESYRLGKRTRYLAMPANPVRRLGMAARRSVRHLRRRPLVLLHALNLFRHGRDAVNLRLLFWALQLMDEGPFDVLHCHFGPVGAMVATLRDMGAVEGRLVTTFHGADLTSCLHEQPERYRRLARRGDLFLAISDYLAKRLLAVGCPPTRLAVHRVGIDLGRFVDRPRQTADASTLRLLTIGRLVDKKGVAVALRAIALARSRGVSLAYTIIGDGPLRDQLERLAVDLGIDDAVAFRGWQVQDAIIEALYGHDVLLAPSMTALDGDQEGIPVTVMEAMATAMPVISTWHSGIPELVEDGVSGLLTVEGDHIALAESILRLADAPELAKSMGRAARQRVSALHDAAALDDQLDGHLRNLAVTPA